MKPQQQHRVDQLEELLSAHLERNMSAQMRPGVYDGVDSEVREMVMLAQDLQASPPLIPDPVFIQGLERKVLAHSLDRAQTKVAQDKPYQLIGRGIVLRIRLVCALLLFFVLTGSGTIIAMAATVSNPDDSLYGVKVWEQHVQLSLPNSPQGRANMSLHIIRDRLNAIPSLTGAAHANAYQQALDDIQLQIKEVASVIETLPPGSERDKLSSELETVRANTRHTLYGVLLKLPLAEQLTTTVVLGQLGMPVPSIESVTVIITTYHTSQAIVTITGANLTSTMRLMINGKLVSSGCTLWNNSCVFTVPWHGKRSPHVIAVVNIDGTSAQITSIQFISIDRNNRRGTRGKFEVANSDGRYRDDAYSSDNKSNDSSDGGYGW
jgi:hypothetical protein